VTAPAAHTPGKAAARDGKSNRGFIFLTFHPRLCVMTQLHGRMLFKDGNRSAGQGMVKAFY
jgi:hypothetical protein